MLCYDTIALVIQISYTLKNYFLPYLSLKIQSLSVVKSINS